MLQHLIHISLLLYDLNDYCKLSNIRCQTKTTLLKYFCVLIISYLLIFCPFTSRPEDGMDGHFFMDVPVAGVLGTALLGVTPDLDLVGWRSADPALVLRGLSLEGRLRWGDLIEGLVGRLPLVTENELHTKIKHLLLSVICNIICDVLVLLVGDADFYIYQNYFAGDLVKSSSNPR